jgi:hypothetical protein
MTGLFTDPAAPNAMTWVAALGYLCLLDQLGSVVERGSPSPAMVSELQRYAGKVEQNFRRPLVQFSNLTPDDASALFALRNCLAHDYSLANTHKRPELCRAFTLHGGTGAFVKHPTVPWNGSFADADTGPDTKTAVSLRLLGDTVESVVAAVGMAHALGEVITKLADEELLARFFVVIRSGSI